MEFGCNGTCCRESIKKKLVGPDRLEQTWRRVAVTYNPGVSLPDAVLLIAVLRKVRDSRDNLHGRVQKVVHGIGTFIATDALELKHSLEVFQINDQMCYG
jgi:hypothetical protein